MKKLLILFVLLLTGCINKQELKDEIINDIKEDPSLITSIISDASEIATECSVSIINNFGIDKESIGTGVIFEKTENEYKILTNEHVIRFASSLEVVIGTSHIEPTVIKEDSELDLAVLSIPIEDELNICAITAQTYEVGEPIISVGTSTSIEYANTVTLGIISRVDDEFIQHDAAINNGSSGGAIFNLSGNIIGLNVSKINTSVSGNEMIFVEGMSFSIKDEDLLDFITE